MIEAKYQKDQVVWAKDDNGEVHQGAVRYFDYFEDGKPTYLIYNSRTYESELWNEDELFATYEELKNEIDR